MTAPNKIIYLQPLLTQSQSGEERRAARAVERGEEGRKGEGGEGDKLISIKKAVGPPLDKLGDKSSSTASAAHSLADVTISLEKELNFFFSSKIISGDKGLTVWASWRAGSVPERPVFPVACLLGWGPGAPRTALTETLWPLSRATQCNNSVCTTSESSTLCQARGDRHLLLLGGVLVLRVATQLNRGYIADSNQYASVRGRK